MSGDATNNENRSLHQMYTMVKRSNIIIESNVIFKCLEEQINVMEDVYNM